MLRSVASFNSQLEVDTIIIHNNATVGDQPLEATHLVILSLAVNCNAIQESVNEFDSSPYYLFYYLQCNPWH